eukprot:m.120689 g.120689  ORF g.120689 m.120689 type:complete len:53 (+) comp37740_c0_seq35:1456-1614(+)
MFVLNMHSVIVDREELGWCFLTKGVTLFLSQLPIMNAMLQELAFRIFLNHLW